MEVRTTPLHTPDLLTSLKGDPVNGWAIPAVVALIFALAVLVSRRLWSHQRAESGLTEWARTARALRWRDRWRLAWATTTGRAVSNPRLAAPAARRGVAIEKMLRRTAPRLKWIWIGLALFWLTTGILRLFEEGGVGGIVAHLAVGVIWACMPQLLAWEIRRARRSADMNQLLARGDGAAPGMS